MKLTCQQVLLAQERPEGRLRPEPPPRAYFFFILAAPCLMLHAAWR
jgi:hypothetical protein